MPMTFDKAKKTWVCSVHGEQDYTGWITCWNCGGEGEFDEYDDDPINYAPGEYYETCEECDGDGGWHVCPICCKDDPDVEW